MNTQLITIQAEQQPRRLPIRKPSNRAKHKLNHDRKLARSIGNRIFQWRGGLYLASRRPKFETLIHQINQLTLDAIHCHDPLLTAVAFSNGCDSLLTWSGLDQINRSLQAWQDHLDSRPRKQTSQRERDEVQRLRKRIDFCFARFKQLEYIKSYNGQQTAEFVLDADSEIELQELLASAVNTPSEIERHLIRIVFWYSGRRAVERYLEAFEKTEGREDEIIARIERAADWLRMLQGKLPAMSLRDLRTEFRKNEAFQTLHEFLTERFRTHQSWRKISGDLTMKLPALIDMMYAAREMITEFAAFKSKSILASWVICDQGTASLPLRKIERGRNHLNPHSLTSYAQMYADISHRPAYDQLLRLINESKLVDNSFETELLVLDLLESKNRISDVLEILKAVQASWLSKDVDLTKLSVLIRTYRKFFGIEHTKMPDEFCSMIQSDQSIDVAQTVLGTLIIYPKSLITSKTKKRVHRLIKDWSEAFPNKHYRERLNLWLTAWANRKLATKMRVDGEENWPATVRVWLRRMSHFQRLASEPTRIPNSLEKQHSFHEKRARELGFLNQRLQAGDITDSQRDRLLFLQTESESGGRPNRGADPQRAVQPKVDRLVHQAQESCLSEALKALKVNFADVARNIWNEQTDYDVQRWSTSRRVTMARWVCNMNSQERKLMQQTIAAWREHGADYKTKLSFNRKWLDKFARKNFNVNQWINPPERIAKVDGAEITLRVVSNPVEIYFMGTYFNTCLSQGGCNEMSVLSNAAQANKQVVYAYGPDETVIGRQIIAINKDFKLIGYHNYVNCKGVLTTTNEQIIAEFARYAGEIARASNVVMSFEENPEAPANLGNHFWYDDCTHVWHKAVRREKG